MPNMPTRKGTVRHIITVGGADKGQHIASMSLTYTDGGGSIPVPPPFLGGAGDPMTPTGQKNSATGIRSSFFGFIAVPRQGDEVAISHLGTRPIASTSATTGAFAAPGMDTPDARFPHLSAGESGQFDGDELRTADVFHGDGSTTIFNFHGAVSIAVDSTGRILQITAPGGCTITGNLNIVGTLSVGGTPITVP